MPTIFITGANRGLGLEFVRQYVESGWKVIATARNPERAKQLKDWKSKYSNLEVYPLDLRDFSQIEDLASRLKGRSIDVLLNNAGVYGGKQSFGSVDYESFRETLLVNTMAPLKVCEAFLEHVASSEWKLILLMSSRMGSIEDNTSGGNYIYRASKAALNMIGKSLSIDLAPRSIWVLILHPGWVRTDMGGSAAPLSVEESIRGMRQVIENYKNFPSGSFVTYAGERLPW